MAVPYRCAMRMLSARSRCILEKPRFVSGGLPQARLSSRYSNPAARTAAPTAPTKAPTFLDQESHVDPDSASYRPQNPMDELAARREEEAHRSNAMNRMRFAGIGLLMSVAGLAAVLYNLDLDEIEKSSQKSRIQLDSKPGDEFHGRHVHVIGAGEDKRIVAEGDQELDLVQTGSGSVPYFPRRVYLPIPGSESAKSETDAPNTRVNPGNVQNQEEYTLVGLGIRTVSFLSIEVYVMGLYIRTSDISTLQSRLIHLINPEASTLVPAEKDSLKDRMLDPTASVEIWEQLLREEGIRSAWRVVPSKNTDFAHLRDGWVNGIKRAITEAGKAKQINPTGISTADYENESFGLAMRDFKSMFSGGRTPKGSVVLLLRDISGSMEILLEDPAKNTGIERVGKVQDDRISRLVWMGYLAGKNVSSEPARKAVVDGFIGFAGRPVGSVETMVI